MGSFGYYSFNDRASINRNDTITGGAGNDVLTGGVGADDFVFANTAVNNGLDTITDFTVAQTDQFNFDAFIPDNDAGVEALAANSGQVLSAGTDDDIFVVNFGAAINGKDFGGAEFAELFGAGKAFLTNDPAAAVKNVIIVQGTDESQAYYLTDAGGAFIAAGDVTQVSLLTALTNATAVVDANIV